MKRFSISVIAISAITSLAGCASMSDTQQSSVTTGGKSAAAAGAAVGAISGNARMGASIGRAAGTAGGYLYDKNKETEQRAYEQERRDADR
jgi:hypothetical protein